MFHRMALAGRSGVFYQSRFAPARAEISGLPKEYRKRGRIGKKGSVYFTEKSFSMDILSNMIFWRGTGANLSLAKNEAGTFTCSGKMLLLDLKNPKAPLFSF